MTSPGTEPAGLAHGQPRRQQRGFITSYGVGRVCGEPDCQTTLSRYNKTQLCWQHADEHEGRRYRDRT